jgi:hypothetical protein
VALPAGGGACTNGSSAPPPIIADARVSWLLDLVRVRISHWGKDPRGPDAEPLRRCAVPEVAWALPFLCELQPGACTQEALPCSALDVTAQGPSLRVWGVHAFRVPLIQQLHLLLVVVVLHEVV